MHRHPLLLTLLLSLACLPACANRPDLSRETIRRLAALDYPKDAERGDDLDVAVVREGKTIRLRSREPRGYPNAQLWLNQQYVRTPVTLPAAGGEEFTLTRFVNEHRERYPVGGFLRPDKSQELVLAELYDPRTKRLHAMTVVPEAEGVFSRARRRR